MGGRRLQLRTFGGQATHEGSGGDESDGQTSGSVRLGDAGAGTGAGAGDARIGADAAREAADAQRAIGTDR